MSRVELDIQYVTDKQGNRIFVQIPFTQWENFRLNLPEDQLNEEITESPELVDQQGVLVVRATSHGDLANITRNERHRRVSELLQRSGV